MNPNPTPNGAPAGSPLLPAELPKVDLSGITNGLSDARNNLNAAVADFSSKSVVEAGSEFVESNTVIAKFAFIIIILLVFMLLFRIGSMIMSYFFMPSSSPFLVEGLISGNTAMTIKQDPRTDNPLVKLSDNANSGIEFTYSVWLNLGGEADTNEHHIFSKGAYDTTVGGTRRTYAPGLFTKTDAGSASLIAYMETMANEGTLRSQPSGDNASTKSVIITDIPFNKWTNVIMRTQNRVLDVYINGVLTKRIDLGAIPRQNFADVFVCQGGGFAGKLADLQYHNYALNVFKINQIVAMGPKTTANAEMQANDAKGFYHYLSSQFYNKQLG